MPPAAFKPSPKQLSGRYLSLTKCEEMALLLVQGHSVCEIARRLVRAASTISHEIRRNAATQRTPAEALDQWHKHGVAATG